MQQGMARVEVGCDARRATDEPARDLATNLATGAKSALLKQALSKLACPRACVKLIGNYIMPKCLDQGT